MSYGVALGTQHALTIEAVENGFIVRTFDAKGRGDFFGGVPCKVAESPEKLAEIISAWGQQRLPGPATAGDLAVIS